MSIDNCKFQFVGNRNFQSSGEHERIQEFEFDGGKVK